MTVFKSGNVAFITGGAGGIGAAIATLCLEKGMDIAIVDTNAELAQCFVDSAKKDFPNAKIEAYIQDVSKSESWAQFLPEFKAKFQKVDFLVLNAGIWKAGNWTDADYFQNIFDINVMGYIYGISSFHDEILKSTIETPKAVVLTGSKQGITNPPGNPAYNASKAAVKSIAEQLHFDLRNNPSTSVHLLVPGWTFTGIGGSAKSLSEKPAGAWLPEQVAKYLLQKMEQGSFYIICPDNEVDEGTDKKRMLWAAGDIVEDRPPLTRWREDWKERAAAELNKAI